jgi:hypothetical protein
MQLRFLARHIEVTRTIEEAVRGVPGVRNVRSTTSRGTCDVSIDFSWDSDMVAATLQIDSAIAHVAAAIALAGLSLFLAWRGVEPAAAALAMTCAWLLLAPNVLPWYALWLLPPLVLRDAPGALLFTGTIALAYLVYPHWLAGGRWWLGWPVRALEYLPCVALAVAAIWRSRRRGPQALAVADCVS